MGSELRANARVWNAMAVTGTNTYTAPTKVIRAKWISWVISWTGTPAGTLSVEASNDPDGVTDANATWTVVPLVGFGNPAGSASNTYVFLQEICFGRVRLKYVNASGSGTMTADVEAKN